MEKNSMPHASFPSTDFESQFSRILESTGCKTQTELAELLEIKHSFVSDAKRRKTIPTDWLAKLLKKRGINPTWIISGVNPRLLDISISGAE